MDLKLEAKYLALENSRNRLLDELEGLDNELLNTSLEPEKWSILQHVAHLQLVDKLTLDSVLYKLARPESLKASTFSTAVKSLLLKFALQSGKKFIAPASVATVPAHSTLPALRQEWDATRFKLEDMLTELPADYLNKCLFKQPRVGMLNIVQTLTFLQDHFDHHYRIIRDMKRQVLKQNI